MLLYRKKKENNKLISYYAIPGGMIEKNETVEEAVKREIKEEFSVEGAEQRPAVRISVFRDQCDGQERAEEGGGDPPVRNHGYRDDHPQRRKVDSLAFDLFPV